MTSPAPITNDGRADRARNALRGYFDARGEQFEDSTSDVADLIADLLHLSERLDDREDPVEAVIRLARLHYDAEAADPEEAGQP